MRRFLNALYLTSGYLAALQLVGICAIVVVQVIFNLIDRLASSFLGAAIGLIVPSYADFAGFFLAGSSFLALAYALRMGAHIRVSLVIHRLPPWAQRWVDVWCTGVAAGFCAFFTYFFARLVLESWNFNDLSPGIVPVPLWMPQSAMLLGAVILTIALIDDFVQAAQGRPPSYSGSAEQLLAQSEPPEH